MINQESKLSIRRQCELLDVSRSSYYYQPAGENQENLALMRLIDERHLRKPTHGVLRMQDFLLGQSYNVDEKRVRRLMRKMGITPIYPKRNLSKLGLAQYIYPYLLRNLDIDRPNQVWEIDITYIPMKKGFMYLTAIIDVYSRFVVGWDISNTMTSEWVMSVLDKATRIYGKPEIINSDQGSQFTCQDWVGYLKRNNIRISMDGKGRATDNAYIERLWRRAKDDYIYLHPAEDGQALYKGLKYWFYEYNYLETHQGIGRKIPVSLYLQQVA
ncbi:MAG: IS3 family transposase [Bacteroidales bacterium]|nr:IS3 family transposase [Bacteroidales bacterium]